MLRHLPNALTLLRLILAPVVGFAVWQSYSIPLDAALSAPRSFAAQLVGAQGWSLAAAVLFILAALTDLFDGMAARALKAESKFGRLIDPIADKALVGLPLIAISIAALRGGWMLWPVITACAVIIVGRDIAITTLRMTAKDGEGARVSQLAKWKTAVELVAVAMPILISASPSIVQMLGLGDAFAVSNEVTYAWIVLLGLAAALSLVTALQYLMAKPATPASP
ncbi:MAG TPA: CDP-alcohol phosphatidyltransferase family protein [Hyphomonadaceae bacterium]|nr:CDP-alcohol phosphatidyltransferase family protein [Hyphomonadaceae bacterium]